MNVKEIRAGMDAALRDAGLEERRLATGTPKVWSLPAAEVVRFFQPQAIRRSWGFIYGGSIGIELPDLRRWLKEFKPGDEASVFRSSFVSYLIINEDVLGEFMVEHGKPVPFDLWAGLIKDRLERVPPTLDGLISAYRRRREELGWLAHPHLRHAWEFLLRWKQDPDPSLRVPTTLLDGRIA